jgi:hypothetical protein
MEPYQKWFRTETFPLSKYTRWSDKIFQEKLSTGMSRGHFRYDRLTREGIVSARFRLSRESLMSYKSR